MQLFGSLKLLMSLLGSSCPLLGRSGPKMDPKMGTKSFPKSDQKMIQNMFKINPSKRPVERSLRRDRRAKAFSTIDAVLSFVFFIFSSGFGALWLPLGSCLGFPEALLGDLWTQKRVKTISFLRVLKRQFFGL